MELMRPLLYILTNTEAEDPELRLLRFKHFKSLLNILFNALRLNTTLVAD